LKTLIELKIKNLKPQFLRFPDFMMIRGDLNLEILHSSKITTASIIFEPRTRLTQISQRKNYDTLSIEGRAWRGWEQVVQKGALRRSITVARK
jgi:hypothetical protein